MVVFKHDFTKLWMLGMKHHFSSVFRNLVPNSCTRHYTEVDIYRFIGISSLKITRDVLIICFNM